jgi:hypothetical protein
VSDYEFSVTIVAEEGGPEPALRERFVTAIVYRLELLNDRDGTYPKAGDNLDFLDSFQGPFSWELTEEEFYNNPPSRVDFDVVDVDPVTPAGSGPVAVTAPTPF